MTCIALVASALVTSAIAAPGHAPHATAKNLRVTAAVRAGLRAAYRGSHGGRGVGPARGSTYYASYGRYEWALGDFDGADDQPEGFRRVPGHAWRDLGDGFGDPSTLCSRVPRPVLAVWHLPASAGGCASM